ncbi:hypothetical protein E7V67_011420 [[Empedobacter] haloabium]|uniref:Uncharacterized protein n=1 Tax=[Empedobacter] haloabium TaxID=592317 RepID=A0ABZ1UT16_9BURK
METPEKKLLVEITLMMVRLNHSIGMLSLDARSDISEKLKANYEENKRSFDEITALMKQWGQND